MQALQALQAQLHAAQQSGADAQAKGDGLHTQLQLSQQALHAARQALQVSQTVATEQTARAVLAERDAERSRLRAEHLQQELAALQQQHEGADPQLRAAIDAAPAALQTIAVARAAGAAVAAASATAGP